MKKILLIIATIAMLFAFTGCTGKTDVSRQLNLKLSNIENLPLAERIIIEERSLASDKGELDGIPFPRTNFNNGQEWGLNMCTTIIGLPLGIPTFLIASLFPQGKGELDKFVERVDIEQERLDKLTPEELEEEEKALAQRKAARLAAK
ncbi:hypothetical protein AAX29_01838 [Aliarcobacter thereius]|uniref:Lipoprotein n=1 Tax=Aliarcobacter thereius TaxID=544718 RepID=A0A1C0B566_9BACT|nr:hypothetical protein [Aliarcobacter thereius]OCL97685.1 hypothetical protein AAX29_01838 [Aliarcobacter thereius]